MDNKNKSTGLRYKTDEEFKKKHLEYVTTKIECECGKMVSRCNMALHKRTKSHQSYLDGGLSKTKNKTVKTLLELKKKFKKIDEFDLTSATSEIDNLIEKLLDLEK